LVGSDPELVRAVGEALVPWHVSLVLLEGEAPGTGASDPVARGRELASAHGAQAVVWLAEGANGWAAWIYDPEAERATARPLPTGPPFDEPTAAAIALSVMTLLRRSAAAPADERIDPPTPPSSHHEVTIEVAVGAEAWASDPDRVEPRFALAVGYWPALTGGLFGIELVARAGPGLAVERGGVSGRLYAARALLRGHVRTTVEEWVLLGLVLGLGVKVTQLEATHASGRTESDLRAVGVLELAGEVGLDLDPVALSVRVGAAASPWIQHYEVDRVPVLESTPVWPLVELGLEIGF